MIMVVVIWFNHNVLDTPYLGYIREVNAMIMVVIIWFNHNVLDTPYLGYIREVNAMIMVVVIWFNHNVLDTPYLGYMGCQCYDYGCCYMVQSQHPRHTLSGIYGMSML